MQKLIIICGPTCVGKSFLAGKIAEQIDVEIISADSRQIYRYMDIGTAKPTADEQKKIPYHLIDIKSPNEKYSAGEFAQDADKKINEVIARNNKPLIVGGTGFYIKALLDGLSPIPQIPTEIRQKIKQLAQKQGSFFLYNKLLCADRIAAKNIHPNDTKKIIRALEVYEYTGKPISYFWNIQPDTKYSALIIFITQQREKLYKRINNRVDRMMELGLLDEVKNLLSNGYNRDTSGMKSVGYQELIDYLYGKYGLDKAIELIKQHTRNFAKRQFTWFRKTNLDLTIDIDDINLCSIIDMIKEFWR